MKAFSKGEGPFSHYYLQLSSHIVYLLFHIRYYVSLSLYMNDSQRRKTSVTQTIIYYNQLKRMNIKWQKPQDTFIQICWFTEVD